MSMLFEAAFKQLVQVLGSIYVNTLHKDVVTCNNNECPLFSALVLVYVFGFLNVWNHIFLKSEIGSVFSKLLTSHHVTFPKSWTYC